MANYDNKLGEWFKQVEKREKELKAKKTIEDRPNVDTDMQTSTGWDSPAAQVESMVVEAPVREAASSSVATILETRSVVADARTIDQSRIEEMFSEGVSEARPISTTLPSPAADLFEDSDAPQVEDFLDFLSHNQSLTSEPQIVVPEPESRAVPLERLSEGTGEPRPIIGDVLNIPVVEEIKPAYVPVASAPVIEPEPVAEVVAEIEPVMEDGLQEKWDRMPHHLQTLFGVGAGEEVAQNSYKAFKESRAVLIQRLLDPPITLEEAARVLNVCPTTVRRYTNRGILKHFRTAGNQRRFRLSDVLTFMETKGRAAEEIEE